MGIKEDFCNKALKKCRINYIIDDLETDESIYGQTCSAFFDDTFEAFLTSHAWSFKNDDNSIETITAIAKTAFTALLAAEISSPCGAPDKITAKLYNEYSFKFKEAEKIDNRDNQIVERSDGSWITCRY
jgi:hypothetical protein